MNKLVKKIIITALALVLAGIVILIVLDNLILPSYVNAPKHTVPDVIGVSEEAAIRQLESQNLYPVVKAERYDEKYPKGHIIYQNPRPGMEVKEDRRIYLFVSGGEPKVKMPDLVDKSIRDARITIERLGLVLGSVEKVKSEKQADLIIGQSIEAGDKISKGDTVDLQQSIGPKLAMIRVPALLGKSLTEADRILGNHSLRMGKVIYEPSKNLLVNTVIEQYPSEGRLMGYGDSVDVVVTKDFSNGD